LTETRCSRTWKASTDQERRRLMPRQRSRARGIAVPEPLEHAGQDRAEPDNDDDPCQGGGDHNRRKQKPRPPWRATPYGMSLQTFARSKGAYRKGAYRILRRLPGYGGDHPGGISHRRFLALPPPSPGDHLGKSVAPPPATAGSAGQFVWDRQPAHSLILARRCTRNYDAGSILYRHSPRPEILGSLKPAAETLSPPAQGIYADPEPVILLPTQLRIDAVGKATERIGNLSYKHRDSGHLETANIREASYATGSCGFLPASAVPGNGKTHTVKRQRVWSSDQR